MRRTVSQIAASLGRAVKVAAAQTSDQASISWPKIAGQASTSGRSTTISWLSTTFASQARGVHRYSRNVRHLNFPPRHSMTRWGLGSNPSGNTVLWSLIAANGAVFLYWRVDPYAASKHFVVSLQSLRDGRLWTAITSAFSQHDGWHLAGNMVSLYFFGSDVGRLFGGRKVSFVHASTSDAP